MAAAQLLQGVGQLTEHLPAAGIHHNGGAAVVGRRGVAQIGKAAQQRRGNIIHAVESDVLQRIDDAGLARAGKTGHNQQLHGASFGVGSSFFIMIIQAAAAGCNTAADGFSPAAMIILPGASHTFLNRIKRRKSV